MLSSYLFQQEALLEYLTIPHICPTASSDILQYVTIHQLSYVHIIIVDNYQFW